MFQLYKNIQTDFLGQIFLELFQFKTRSLFLGHPVYLGCCSYRHPNTEEIEKIYQYIDRIFDKTSKEKNLCSAVNISLMLISQIIIYTFVLMILIIFSQITLYMKQ